MKAFKNLPTVVVATLAVMTLNVSANLVNLASAVGGVNSMGMTAFPCPKNYMFTCQPHLAPVPCTNPHQASSFGSVGAYSENLPTVVALPFAAAATYPGFHQHHQPLASVAIPVAAAAAPSSPAVASAAQPSPYYHPNHQQNNNAEQSKQMH